MTIYKYPENLGKEEFIHAICISIYERMPSSNSSSSRSFSSGEAKAFRTNNAVTYNKSALSGTTNKMSDSIMLYMPKDLSYEYNMSYSNTEFSGIQLGAAKIAASSIPSVKEWWDNPSSFFEAADQASGAFDNIRNLQNEKSGKEIAQDAASSIGDAAAPQLFNLDQISSALPISIPQTYSTISAFSKVAKNPHMEYIFEKVSNRTFNFSFIFTPKSSQESSNIREIIKLLKKSAHPKINAMSGNTGMFYDYPCVFDIDFVTNDSSNEWLPQISTCILTSIKSSPISDSGFSTFYDGAPTKISLSLSFEELNALSREDIENGF